MTVCLLCCALNPFLKDVYSKADHFQKGGRIFLVTAPKNTCPGKVSRQVYTKCAELAQTAHIVVAESKPRNSIFCQNDFLQRGNTCHSARLLSNFRTSRPIRTPLDP